MNAKERKNHKKAADPLDFFNARKWAERLHSLEKNGGYQEFLDFIPDGVGILDQDGYILACNQKMLLMYGYEVFDELRGKHITAFMEELSREKFEKKFRKLATTVSPVQGEMTIIGKDGNRCVVQRNAYPLVDQNDVFFGAVIYDRDISIQHKLANEFRKLYRAVDQSANIIVITDKNGAIEYINPKFIEVTGYGYRDVLGKNPNILKSGQQDDTYYETLWKTILAGEEWRGKFYNKRKDGSLYWEQANIVPIFDANGQITHFVGIKEDITQQMEAEEHLLNLVQERTQALAVANTQLEQRVGEFNILYQVMKSATLSVHLDEILQHTVDAINQTIEPDNIAVLLIEKGSQKLVIRACSGFRDGPKLTRRPLGVGIPGIVALRGETIILPDVRKHNDYYACDSQALSEVCVPLKVGKQILGSLNLESHKVNAFSAEDIRLLTILANNLAIVIQNSQLFEDTVQLKEFNENIIQSIGEAIVFEDEAGYFTFANPATEKLLGYSVQELIGLHWTEVFPKYRHQDIREEIARKDQRYYESEIITKDQRLVPVIISARSLYHNGKFTGILATLINISQRVEAEKKLREYAMTDALTGIYNRRYFFNIAQQEIERAKRYQRSLAVLLFDIDRFKQVNDTHGHGVGDQVLHLLCAECKKKLRENDIFARYGGEEFVILLPEADEQQARQLAERIRKDIAALEIPVQGGSLSVTLSLGGVSLNRISHFDLDGLLLHADKALYQAKGRGRNCVVFWKDDE